MKKRLEAELISIAHRILKLKNKSEVDQLYKETQKLYEALSILKFYQDNFESVKSDVAEDVLEEKLEQSLETETVPETVAEVKEKAVEPIAEVDSSNSEQVKQIEPEVTSDSSVSEQVEEIVEEDESEEEVIVSEETEKETEEVLEDSEEEHEEDPNDSEEEEEIVASEEPSFIPSFELEDDEEIEDEPADTNENVPDEQTESEEKLEDHIGKYADPIFEKINDVSLFPSETPAETREEVKAAIPAEEPKTTSINESKSKSIAIGLNDRIGFVQHLFNDSNEDFNRVISQLNTFDTFEEAKNFINEMVIPDYNYWVGEEDYIERFMEIVEKKFT